MGFLPLPMAVLLLTPSGAAAAARVVVRVTPENQLGVAVDVPGPTAISALRYAAIFADTSPAFETSRIDEVTESGGATVYRFALSGPAADQAEVTARVASGPRGVILAWTVRYRGDPKGFFPWTTGVRVDYAAPLHGASAQPTVRWVEPDGKREWEVSGDAPYPDFDCQIRRVRPAGLPSLAFVTDWYDPDWIYGNDANRARLLRAGLPKESPSETTFTFAILHADDAEPEDLAAVRQGRPLSLKLGTGRTGNLFEPNEPITLAVRIANVTDAAVSAQLRVEVRDYYGTEVARHESKLRLAPGESRTTPLRLVHRQRGILFAAAHVSVPGKPTETSLLTIGLLPSRPPTPPDPASPFGLAALIADPETYPDQYDPETVVKVAQRIGVRWLRACPFPLTREVTPEEEQATRDRVSLFRRYGISLHTQLGFGITEQPSWQDDLRAVLARLRGVSDYVELGNELNPHSQPDEQRRAAREHVERYFRPFHDLMRQAHPTGKAMPFGLGGVEAPYLEGFGEAGGFQLAAVMSIHPGSFPRAPEWDGGNEFWALLPQLRTLKDACRRFGEKEFWVTEIYAPTPPVKQGLDLRTAADYVVRTYLVCLDAGARVIEWYQLQDGVWFGRIPRPTDVEYSFGLVYTDLSPKPAYLAYGVMTEQLQGLRYLGRGDLGAPDLFAYGFGGAEPTVWVLYSYREKHELDHGWSELKDASRRPAMPWENRWRTPVSVTLPAAGPVTATDIMGNSTTVRPAQGTVALSLTGSPVFVRGLALPVRAAGR